MTHHADATTPRGVATARRGTRQGPRPARHGVAALAVVALTLAACGSSSPSTATTAAGPSNSGTARRLRPPRRRHRHGEDRPAAAKFGTILVNSAGMALYTYGPNNGGTTNKCTGACLQAWPAVTVPAGTTPTLASGVSGTLATAKQADGTIQVTYNGQLLYTFVSDTSPGQVTGNGVAKLQRGQGVRVDVGRRAWRPTTRRTTKAHDHEGADDDRRVGRGLPVLIPDASSEPATARKTRLTW